MRDALAVQVAQHAGVGDQIVRQHHQVGVGGCHRGMRLAAVLDPGARTAQRLDQQVRQRARGRAPGSTPTGRRTAGLLGSRRPRPPVARRDSARSSSLTDPQPAAWRCRSLIGIGERMDRSSAANSAAVRPAVAAPARRGADPSPPARHRPAAAAPASPGPAHTATARAAP